MAENHRMRLEAVISGAAGPSKAWAWRFWWAACCLLAGLGLFHAWAQAAPPLASRDLDWAQPGPNLPLTPHLRYFKEEPGQPLDWRQALDAGGWRAADPEGMSALHQRATMWMVAEVENTSSSVLTRWVVTDYWALMDVQLFVLDGHQPQLLAHQRSGQGLAPRDRALDTEKAAFSVTLLPGQRARLLLRVSDLYWSHMRVQAWDGAAYARAEAGRKLWFAVGLGVVLALFIVLLLQRDKTMALVAVWMLLSWSMELTYAGLTSEFVVPARLLSPVMVLLLLGVLTSSASSFVTMHFMGLEGHRFWHRWNWGLFVVALVLALWVLDTRSNLTRQGLSLLNVIQVLSNLAMLAWARIRGNPLRQWMAVIMSINFVLAIARVVVRQYYVEPVAFVALMNAVLSIKGSLVLTVIVLVTLQRRRDLHEVRERLRLAELQQLESLQAAVDQRTAELRQALVAANDANRAKADFLARVSHDLRSPLTSITGYAQLLQRVEGRTGSLAQTIRRSADHMLVLVNDLIEYARGASGDRPDLKPVYIHGMLDEVAREAAVLAERRHNRFVLRLETELPTVLVVDARRLRRMLTNLLDNAAKFTHEGLVELLVSVSPLPAAVGAQVGRMTLRMAVRDTGQGVAGADQGKLFEPFFRASGAEDVPGVGLGLSIVQTWAERLGGTLSVLSSPGRGSTFTLCLPVEVGTEAGMAQLSCQDDARHLPPLDGAGRRVWVVEDYADIRELLAEELRTTGFEVIASPDGADFLQRMRDPRMIPPALVLTDSLMPGADGAAVLRAVRERWPEVPVVLLSATQQTMESMGVAQDEGFDASLMKPVSLLDLRITLAHLLCIEGEQGDAELSSLA